MQQQQQKQAPSYGRETPPCFFMPMLKSVRIKRAAGVHEKSEPQVGGQGRAALCSNDKLAVGFCGAFSLLRFFLQKKK